MNPIGLSDKLRAELAGPKFLEGVLNLPDDAERKSP